jgi:hypothetical protein
MYIITCVYIHIYTYIRMYFYMFVCAYIRIYVYMFVYVYIRGGVDIIQSNTGQIIQIIEGTFICI